MVVAGTGQMTRGRGLPLVEPMGLNGSTSGQRDPRVSAAEALTQPNIRRTEPHPRVPPKL